MNAPLLEIVGMDKISKKQSHLGDLSDISVGNCNINHAGNLGQLKNIVCLDVSSTLIWNWRTIADIVRQLPSLRYLDLANNRLTLPTEEEIEKFKDIFNNLEGINMRNCGYTWSEILHVARLWPNIQSLSLQDNKLKHITKISNQKAAFKNLQMLDLQGNDLEDFDDILNLGYIRTLRELHLAGNQFKRIKFSECLYDEKVPLFPALLSLNIRDNPIVDEFECFNELDKLTSLQNIHVSPTSQADFENMAVRAVALITSLKALNKRIISDSDRRNSEIDLWKQFAIKWIDIKDKPQERLEFLNQCRAYVTLVKRFGCPELEMVQPVKKQSTLVKIKLVDCRTGKVLEKKLPYKMSMQALYGLVGKLFSNTDDAMIFGIDNEHTDIKIPLENSSKTLDFFSIKDGDTILIE